MSTTRSQERDDQPSKRPGSSTTTPGTKPGSKRTMQARTGANALFDSPHSDSSMEQKHEGHGHAKVEASSSSKRKTNVYGSHKQLLKTPGSKGSRRSSYGYSPMDRNVRSDEKSKRNEDVEIQSQRSKKMKGESHGRSETKTEW